MREKKEINVQVGEQIRIAREKHGLTQEQFAELIDKTPQFISDLERGVCGVSLVTLKDICERLCITSDSILFGSRETASQEELSGLVSKISLMPPEQVKGVNQIVCAFQDAVNIAKHKGTE